MSEIFDSKRILNKARLRKIAQSTDMQTLLKSTKLKDFLPKDVVSINVDRRFSEVPKVLKDHDIRHLPVVNQKNELVGLVTERDLYHIKPPRKLIDGTEHYDDEMLNDVILEHAMTKDVLTISPEATVGDALVELSELRHGCFPVVDESNILRGILTRYDVLRIMAEYHLLEKSKKGGTKKKS